MQSPPQMCIVIVGLIFVGLPVGLSAAATEETQKEPRLTGEEVIAFVLYPQFTEPPHINTLSVAVKRSDGPSTEAHQLVITSIAPARVPLGWIFEAETDANERVTILMFTHTHDKDFHNAVRFLRRVQETDFDFAQPFFARQKRELAPMKDVPYRNFIVMEHIGRTLDKVMPESELSTLARVTVAHQLLKAMSSLHARNVHHLCLRPEVIGFGSSDGNIKIFDFGCASTREDYDQHLDAHMENNLWYTSPEAALRRGTDWGRGSVEKQDVFEVGLILYELFSGEKLYNRERLETLIVCMYRNTEHPPMKRSCAIFALAFYYKAFLDENEYIDELEQYQLQNCPALKKQCKEHYDTDELNEQNRFSHTNKLQNIANEILNTMKTATTVNTAITSDGIHAFFGSMLAYRYEQREISATLLANPLFQSFGLN